MEKRIERRGASSEPYTYHYPEVRGGICEYCGVLDPNVDSKYQYKLCPHFRGIGALACSYCPEHRDQEEVIRSGKLNVHVHPTDPNQLVVVCGSFECAQKHEQRFRINR